MRVPSRGTAISPVAAKGLQFTDDSYQDSNFCDKKGFFSRNESTLLNNNSLSLKSRLVYATTILRTTGEHLSWFLLLCRHTVPIVISSFLEARPSGMSCSTLFRHWNERPIFPQMKSRLHRARLPFESFTDNLLAYKAWNGLEASL